MIKRLATHLLLRPEDVPASHDDWEVIGTFNPGAIRHGDDVILLIRVAERPREQRTGWTPLPRWSCEDGFSFEWIRNEELEFLDPRVVRRRADGLVRLTFVSHLRVVISHNGRTIDRIGGPAILPQHTDEEYGIEDARITAINGRYYITYVAVSRHGAATALASTTDFARFDRHGIIFCPENKDVVLFPQRFGNDYVALHRPVTGTPFSPPQMWIARSPDLVHWGQHRYLYGGQRPFETGRVGAGTPPVLMDQGWLEIYHGNLRPSAPGQVGAYFGASMLLAKDEPERVLRTSVEPILVPESEFEREGFVANVVFPTGVVDQDDRLLVYYGASDKYCGMVELARDDLLRELT
jgi:predicted GH43/DUF377 family glycosyl hydrolase